MCASLQCKEAPNVQKPQFFLWFLMFFTYRQLFTQAYKRHNIAPGACRTELPSHIVQKTRLGGDSGGAWGSLGPHLACFWALLGGSRPLLGGSWAPLGHCLGSLPPNTGSGGLGKQRANGEKAKAKQGESKEKAKGNQGQSKGKTMKKKGKQRRSKEKQS